MSRIYCKVVIDPNNNKKTSPNSTGAYKVHVLVCQRNKKVSIIPKIPNIPLNMFNGKDEGKWVKKTFPEAGLINHHLNKICSTIRGYLLQSEIEGSINSIQGVKDWYIANHTPEGKKIDKTGETFYQFYKRKSASAGSKKLNKNFRLAFNKVKLYKDPTFDNINRSFFTGFASFLENNADHKVKGSSAKEYFARTITLYREWCRELKVTYDPTQFERIPFKDSTSENKRSLDWPQIEEIKKITFNEDDRELEIVRDIFIFMCYTSRYYNEIKDLTFEDNFLYENNNPEWPIVYDKRKKTKVAFYNPLIDKEGVLIKIFEKYHPVKKGRMFPQFYINGGNTSNKLNKLLEIIGQKAKIDFKLINKTARYTFESTIAVEYPPKLAQRMMGHSRIQTQTVYTAVNSDMYSLTAKALGK